MTIFVQILCGLQNTHHRLFLVTSADGIRRFSGCDVLLSFESAGGPIGGTLGASKHHSRKKKESVQRPEYDRARG
jgi:hypothetical protein